MIGSKLKELRETREMTQEELAKFLGVSRSALGLWEQGRRDIPHDTIIKIAGFFKVSTDYLYGITPTKTPYQSPKTISELREGKIAYGDLTDAQKRILARSEEMSEKDQKQFADLAEAFFKTRQDNKKE